MLRGLCDLLGNADAVARLRAAGLKTVRVGSLELHFASAPSGPQSIEAHDDSPPTERRPETFKVSDDDERAALELLLHSSGGDPDALYDMQNRMAARAAKAEAA